MSNSNTSSRHEQHRTTTTGHHRFPSPPPPPQQRRSSLSMSLPSLEHLLTQAPPADLSITRRTTTASTSTTTSTTNTAVAAACSINNNDNKRAFSGDSSAGVGTQPATLRARRPWPSFATASTAAAATTTTTTTAGLDIAPQTPPLTRMPPVYDAAQELYPTLLTTSAAAVPPHSASASSLPPPETQSSFKAAAAAVIQSRRSSPRFLAAGLKKPPPQREEPTAISEAEAAETTASINNKRCRRSSISSGCHNYSKKCGGVGKKPKHHPQKLTSVTEACCICMSLPEALDVASISGCAHSFCYGCIRTWSETENSCPLCKARFTSIRRIHGSGGGGGKGQPAVTRVLQRNQRSEAGIALDSLLQSLAGGGGVGVLAGVGALGGGGNSNNRQQHHHHLSRFLLRSLGSGATMGGGLPQHRGFGNMDLMDDNDPFLPGFMNVILRSSSTSSSFVTTTTTMTTTRLGLFQESGGSGGRTLETAIEIDDSDDDDVQVLDNVSSSSETM